MKQRNRNSERRHLDEDARLLLLEQDMDSLEQFLHELREEVKRTNRVLTGVLLSLVTGILIYVAQLLIGIAMTPAPGV